MRSPLALPARPRRAAELPRGGRQAFGAREDVQQISLSPDGTKVAIVAAGRARRDADDRRPGAGGAPRSMLRSTGDPERLTDCDWVTDTRLVCRVY